MKRQLADEAATVSFGKELVQQLLERYQGNALVFLQGQLGAGKTTLVRGLLRALGYEGNVKSPTYTLLEPYEIMRRSPGLSYHIFHFDLYRVQDAQELGFVGFDEIIESEGLKLVEWPERGTAWLPKPDVEVKLTVQQPEQGSGRLVEVRFYTE